jgi:hypothetical protein
MHEYITQKRFTLAFRELRALYAILRQHPFVLLMSRRIHRIEEISPGTVLSVTNKNPSKSPSDQSPILKSTIPDIYSNRETDLSASSNKKSENMVLKEVLKTSLDAILNSISVSDSQQLLQSIDYLRMKVFSKVQQTSFTGSGDGNFGRGAGNGVTGGEQDINRLNEESYGRKKIEGKRFVGV